MNRPSVASVCALVSLAQINLSFIRIGPEGAKAVGEALEDNASVTRVDVRHNSIAGDGASSLAAAVVGNTMIEVFNEIPIKDIRADSFTELNLRNKRIGVEGGMVVAALLPAMASLTSVR